MARLDTLIRSARLVDGTGGPERSADVAIARDRIAAVADAGSIEPSEATEVVDGTGLVLTPGFVDPHTHYDAQLFWDPHATPSSLHGVTTVIGGNCGFTIAPLAPDDDLFEVLGIDSLQALDLLTDLEDAFDVEIPDYEVQGVNTLGGLAELIEARR